MKLGVFFGAILASLAAVPVAMGAGSAQVLYGGTEGVSQVQVQHHVAATASSSSALPFTGLDLMLLGGGGLLLLLAGVALYLISRPRRTTV